MDTMNNENAEFLNLLSLYSDVHKEARGFRPRGLSKDLTVEDLRDMIADMDLEAHAAAESLRQEEQAAVVRFEARLAEVIAHGAGDRSTAIRWFLEGEGTTDLRQLEWSLGLPYGHLG